MNSKYNLDLIEEKNTTILKLTLILDKLFIVLDDFRDNLQDFKNNCKCIENFKNKTNFNDLDNEYKTIINEYKQNKSKIDRELGLSSDTLKKNKTSVEIINCQYESCDYQTFSSNCLQQHILDQHWNKRPTKCWLTNCQFLCWGPTKLTEHVKNCHSEILINCSYDYCDFATLYLRNLNKHINNIHKDKSAISCDECEFKCWNSVKLNQHWSNVHGRVGKILLIKQLNSSAIEPNSSDPRRSQDMKLFVCHICDRFYRNKVKLLSHMNLVHKKGPRSIAKENDQFICPFPDCSFKSEYRFRVYQHIKQTHLSRRFNCSVCFKTFKTNDCLKKHYIRFHSTTHKTVPEITNSFVRNFVNNRHRDIGSEPLKVEQPNTSKQFEEDLIFDISADDYFQHNQKSMWKQIDINGKPSESGPKSSIAEDVNQIIDNTLIKDFVFGSNLMNKVRQQKQKELEEVIGSTLINNEKPKKIVPKIKKPVLMCDENSCKFKTVLKGVLDEHKRTFHRKSSLEICNCGLEFNSIDMFVEHQFTCDKSNVYVCGNLFCSFQCSGPTELSEHMKTHSVILIPSETNDSNQHNSISIEQSIVEQSIEQNSSPSSPSEQNPDIPVLKQNNQKTVGQMSKSAVKMKPMVNPLNSEAKNMCPMSQSNDGSIHIKVEPQEADNSVPEQTSLSTDGYKYNFNGSTFTFETNSDRIRNKNIGQTSEQNQTKNKSCSLNEDNTSLHNCPVKQTFRCDVNLCDFQSNDIQAFTEHKNRHLNENIDKIISEFQFGIKRVEIKTEIEEQNTVFVNPEKFLAKSSDNCSLSRNNSIDSQKYLSNDCQKQTIPKVATGCQSSSGTAKRIRGLNSVREPIRLPTKSTKKISELFKR